MNELALVQKVWNYAHVLRDQGVPYQAYISQISYLLFLKMDEERGGLVASGLIKGEQLGAPGGLPLAGIARPARRRVDAALFGDPRPALAPFRHRRHHFSQSAERDPGPGEAAAARRPDRRRNLARPRRRCQGLDLRGAARAQCAGSEVGCGAIFHAARADRRDGDGGRSRAAGNRPRPRLRHRRLSARRLGANAQEAAGAQCRDLYRDAIKILGRRHRARSGAAVRDEPLSARHRRRAKARSRRATRCSATAGELTM